MAKNKYQTPQIKKEKIEVSFFAKNRFLDSAVAQLVPPVFAQSSGDCGCQDGLCSSTCEGCWGNACAGDCSLCT